MFTRRYFKVALLGVCILAAAAPPLGFARFMDAHVVGTAEHTLADYADRMIGRVEAMVQEGTSTLAMLHRTGATSCDLRAREALRLAVTASRTLRHLMVTGEAGECGSLPLAPRFTELSDQLPISSTTSLFVTSDEQHRRALAVQFRPSHEDRLVAYFLPESSALDMLPEGWRRHGQVMLMLSDETIFEEAQASVGLSADFRTRSSLEN